MHPLDKSSFCNTASKQTNKYAVLQYDDLANGSNQEIKIWNSLTGLVKRTVTGLSNFICSLIKP
jgi:hypothetical protein